MRLDGLRDPASMATASTGYFPMADSPESITQSVPSRIALATSVDSARVGRRFSVIGLEHLRGRDHRFPEKIGLAHEPLLNHRDLLDGDFHP